MVYCDKKENNSKDDKSKEMTVEYYSQYVLNENNEIDDLVFIKKYDINKLCNAYFDKYCVNISDFYYNDFYLKYKKVTFGDYEKRVKKHIKDNITYLRNIKTKKVKLEDNCVFIAHKYIPFFVSDGLENFAFLYKISEIINNKKNINSYAFELNLHNEMLSYLVADTLYNKEHIENILVDFLYEVTFFGNGDEHDTNVKKEIDVLLESEKEIKASKEKSIKYDYYKFLKEINKYSKINLYMICIVICQEKKD